MSARPAGTASATGRPRIRIILAAWNVADLLPEVGAEIARGITATPDVAWSLDAVDDGSTDGTVDALLRLAAPFSARGLASAVTMHAVNRGLVPVLLDRYRRAVTPSRTDHLDGMGDVDYILKLDGDRDLPAAATMGRMAELALAGAPVAVGQRTRLIPATAHAVEHVLQRETAAAVAAAGLPALSCAGMSVQLYRRDFLTQVLAEAAVATYRARWGLDLLIPLLAVHRGLPLAVVDLGPGGYDPMRRPDDKVRAQYGIYADLLAAYRAGFPRDDVFARSGAPHTAADTPLSRSARPPRATTP